MKKKIPGSICKVDKLDCQCNRIFLISNNELMDINN